MSDEKVDETSLHLSKQVNILSQQVNILAQSLADLQKFTRESERKNVDSLGAIVGVVNNHAVDIQRLKEDLFPILQEFQARGEQMLSQLLEMADERKYKM